MKEEIGERFEEIKRRAIEVDHVLLIDKNVISVLCLRAIIE